MANEPINLNMDWASLGYRTKQQKQPEPDQSFYNGLTADELMARMKAMLGVQDGRKVGEE